MNQRPFAPSNGGITPITFQHYPSQPHWGGDRVLCREQRQPSSGLAKVMWALYYGLVLGMAFCVIGGITHYLSVKYEHQRIAAEQAAEYNKSIREMEKILLQMQRQRASAELEIRNH